MDTQTQHTGAHTNRTRSAYRRLAASATLGTALLFAVGSTAHAHGGEGPDETIPEAARAIIDDTTTGGSTTLIYAGIAGLVLAGAAMFALNLVKQRQGAAAPHTTATSGDAAGTGSCDVSSD